MHIFELEHLTAAERRDYLACHPLVVAWTYVYVGTAALVAVGTVLVGARMAGWL